MRSRNILFAVSFLLAPSLYALIGETPTIKAASFVPGGTAAPLRESVALIGDTQLIVRSVGTNGALAAPDQTLALPAGARAADVQFSRVFAPDSILVLCDDLTLLEYEVAFDSGRLPKLIGDVPAIRGPFGDPAVVGAGTVLAEGPDAIGIGTANGALIIVRLDSSTSLVDLGKGAVTGLATVPQVGYFAFAAAHEGRVQGVNPSGAAVITFDLADPRPDPLIDLSLGAVFEPNDEPLKEPAAVSFVSANGTKNVAVLQIPPSPAIGGTLTVTGIVVVGGCPIGEVDRGSLLMLATDGGALFYDPGFDFESGGSGVTWTIAGASADADPDTLNLGSNGTFVTLTIEAENDSAGAIDAATLQLGYAAAVVKPSPAFAADLGDSDHDGQLDLLVKFDRATVIEMLADAPDGPASLAVTWTYTDGSSGSAEATITVQRRRN